MAKDRMLVIRLSSEDLLRYQEMAKVRKTSLSRLVRDLLDHVAMKTVAPEPASSPADTRVVDTPELVDTTAEQIPQKKVQQEPAPIPYPPDFELFQFMEVEYIDEEGDLVQYSVKRIEKMREEIRRQWREENGY